MRPLAYLAVLAVSAALVAAVPVQAEPNDSNLFAKLEADFASWQTADSPWSDYYRPEGDAGCGCGDVGCGDVDCGGGCGGCRTSGIIAGVEMPILQAHYGACSITIPGEAVQLPELTPAFDHETTPRFWLGLKSCDGLAFRIRYWQYDHTASGVDVANRYYVDVGLAAENLDFEISQSASFCNWELEITGGARWAKLVDDIYFDYDGDQVAWWRNFEGGGPTFAIAVRRQLGIGNLALVGNFRASLIYGDTDLALSYDFPDDDADDITAGLGDQLMEIYEIQVGAEWSTVTCSGYRVAGRVVLEGQAWELAPGPGPLGLFDTNVGFVGPSFSLAIER